MMADTSDCADTCVVCFKTVEFYSIGQCDHPVCYECSTRMRVLCLQNECPICRQMLSRVVFTDKVQPYETLRNQPFSEKLFERQYKIVFCTEEIKKAYERVLEHRCKICTKLPPFRTFEMLSDHTRKVHEKFYCDLCVKNLKIFSSERKCYTRQELAHHRRKGDLDDTSHRGHPLCEFCEVRYMDNDDLYRHLRVEHLYCHLCDADGCNQYYASHSELARHFRTDHYLCEDGECAGNHLTSVFRTEIDLKAHKAQVHGRGMPRAAARQARTLELQFNVTPHPTSRQQQRNEQIVQQEPPPPRPVSTGIDTRSEDQFPTLGAAPSVQLTPITRHYLGTSNGLARTRENFPALDGSRSGPLPAPTPPRGPPAAAVLKTNGKSGVSIKVHGQPASASNFRVTGASGSHVSAAPRHPAPRRQPFHDDDFPSLAVPNDERPSLGAATPQPPKVTLVSSEQLQSLKSAPASASSAPARPRLDADAFPALAASAAPAVPPQWITVSKPKEKPKATKVAPAPKLPAPAFNPVADFPQLAAKSKSKSQQRPASEETRKSKKKQNGKVSPLEEMFYNGADSTEKASAWDAKKAGKENKTREAREAGAAGSAARESFPALSRRGASELTFTNSSGERFAAPLHSYAPPPDFDKRNVELVRRFASALGPAAAERFKGESRAFRQGALAPHEFVASCRRSLGAHFDELFPSLVALLPDIGKQQALAAASGEPGAGGLDACAACGQMLLPRDVAHHRAAHWTQ